MMFDEFDKECMTVALTEAKRAYQLGEVPVGAVLVLDNKIISRAHNLVETNKDATAHAEILCMKAATKQIDDWRLCNSTLYVTLEPCSMCAGAAILSRLKRIVFGADDLRHGAAGSWVNLFKKKHPIHQIEIISGLMKDESKQLMQNFFKERREWKKKFLKS